MNVCYISSNLALAEAIVTKYQDDGVNFYDFRKVATVGMPDAVLIITPMYVQDRWISYVGLWQAYLFKKYPTVPFLAFSFDQNIDDQYFDLLKLQPTFAPYLEQSYRLMKKGGSTSVFFYDTIEQVLKRFFAGHGDESVMEVLYQLKRKMHVMARELRIGEWTYEKIVIECLGPDYTIRSWTELRNRWNRYAAFFEFSPYKNLFFEIGEKINLISPFFDKKCEREDLFLNLECESVIQSIIDTLAEIREMLNLWST